MPHYWTKDHKYYRLSTQDNLFGTTDLICNWGSLYSNQGNCKVIHCHSQHDMDQNIKRITKIKKARGYQLTFPDTSNTSSELLKCNTMDKIADTLRSSDQYRVVKRYIKPSYYHLPDNTIKQIGVFLDTETTGLSYEKDKILELGMVKFEYTKDGHIYRILDEIKYAELNLPIPEASLRGIDGKFSFGPFCFDYNNRGKPRGIYPKEI